MLRVLMVTLFLLPGIAGASPHSAADALGPSAAPAPRLATEIATGIPLLPVAPDETWLYIDLRNRGLVVFRGREVIRTINHVAIGKNGAQRIRLRGSNMTPIGTFRVERINPASRFHTFFGLNYPTPEIAQEAVQSGRLSHQEATRIRQHFERHQVALPNTSLGGHIGIHGLGGRSPFLHREMDWTEGCLAVTDEEIRELAQWVRVGTSVLIEG